MESVTDLALLFIKRYMKTEVLRTCKSLNKNKRLLFDIRAFCKIAGVSCMRRAGNYDVFELGSLLVCPAVDCK